MAAPNNPRSATVVVDLGLRSDPKIAPGPEAAHSSADRSTATVGGIEQSFSWSLVGSGSTIIVGPKRKRRWPRMPEAEAEFTTRVLDQDERPLRAPLTTPQVTTGGPCS